MSNKCELDHSDKLLLNEKFKVQYCLQCDSLWPILPLATESGEEEKEKNNPEKKENKNKKKMKKQEFHKSNYNLNQIIIKKEIFYIKV